MDQQIKLYSNRTIGIATFFGGPLAAGWLVRQNFINLGRAEQGKWALVIGIVATLLLFAGIFAIPETVIEKIPNSLIPAVYSLIIFLLVENIFGEELKKHKESNGAFYSGWKAAGVGAVSFLILGAGLVGYAYSITDSFDTEAYDKGLAEIQQNEEAAMELYALVSSAEPEEVSAFIRNTGLPAWQQNLKTLETMDQIEGLYDEFRQQNALLREYCQLRINAYQLIEKAVLEDTPKYDQQIEEIHQQIDVLVEKL